MRLEISDVVKAPVARVFELATDIDRAREWLPPDVRTVKLTDGPTRVGSRYRETRKILGRDDTQVYEITLLDAPKRAEVCANGKQGEFRFRLDFEPVDDHTTRLIMSGTTARMGCIGFFFAPIIRHVMRKDMAGDLAALKRWIEEVTSKPA